MATKKKPTIKEIVKKPIDTKIQKKYIKPVKNTKKVQHKPPKTILKLDFKKIEKERNERQERFCQLYASDKEFFGNGVETYLEVYDIDRSKPNWYKTACTCASKLLSNAKVYNRINELFTSGI